MILINEVYKMYEEIVNKIVEKTGKNRQEVMDDALQIEKEIKEMFPNLEQVDLEKRVSYRLFAFYRKLIQSNASVWKGYILGYGDVENRNRWKEQYIKNKIQELGRERAIEEGYIDKDGNYLVYEGDYKGRILKPFYVREVVGIASYNNKPPKLFVMSQIFNSDKGNEIPLFTPVEFTATLREDLGDKYLLTTRSTEFKEIEDKLPELDTIINKFLKPISVLEAKNKDGSVCIKGYVDSYDEYSGSSTRVIALSDPESLETEPISVFLPSSLDVYSIDGFAVNTMVITCGYLSKPRENGKQTFRATTIYVPKEWRVKKSGAKIREEDIPNTW